MLFHHKRVLANVLMLLLLAMQGCDNPPAGIQGKANNTRPTAEDNEAAAAATIRTLTTSQITYTVTYPNVGYAPDLKTLGPDPDGKCSSSTADHACLIDARLACATQPCVKDFYQYTITPIPAQGIHTDFVIFATPVERAVGRKNYCATSDGVIRFQMAESAPSPAVTRVAECNTWLPL